MQPMLLERPPSSAPPLPARQAAPVLPVRPAVNFEEEVRRCQGQLYRIALSLTGSESDAWDAVQEALLRAYTHLHQYRGDSAFSTWVVRILYRTCYDELRRRGRRPLPLGGWSAGGRGDDRPDPAVAQLKAARPGVWEPDPAAAAPDPADVAEQHELQAGVRRAIRRLPRAFRQVVSLQLNGLSYLEICDQLQLPAGTVKSRLHRARTLLRAELEPHTFSPRPAG